LVGRQCTYQLKVNEERFSGMPARRTRVDRLRAALERNEALLARQKQRIERTREGEKRAALISDARKIRRFSAELERRLAELTDTETGSRGSGSYDATP
jgi:hypothetical protein